MITLRHTGTYKDGGSKSFIGSDGKEYWLCNKFGERHKHLKGNLFIGNINKFPHKLAVGEFLLKSKYSNTHPPLIKQL